MQDCRAGLKKVINVPCYLVEIINRDPVQDRSYVRSFITFNLRFLTASLEVYGVIMFERVIQGATRCNGPRTKQLHRKKAKIREERQKARGLSLKWVCGWTLM
jgi:hypothetical protein